MSEIRAEDLPAFQVWSKQFDTSAYLTHEVGITAATIVSELFFPELIAVRDCVLLADRYEPANFDAWWKQTNGDPTAVERVINHLHLWDLFDPSGDEEARALEVMADRIARSWRCRAEAGFPERAFEVTVTSEYGPTIVMYCRRDDP